MCAPMDDLKSLMDCFVQEGIVDGFSSLLVSRILNECFDIYSISFTAVQVEVIVCHFSSCDL